MHCLNQNAQLVRVHLLCKNLIGLMTWSSVMFSKSFGRELACLNSNKPLLKSSRILSLNPFLDKDGILRIGGRTGEHPIILSHDDSIIVNIIRHFHRNAHLGVEWTLGLLRE